MAITVTPPLATPAPVLTASAGGSLAAGTYEVAVACANTSSYSTIQVDQRRSAAWIGQIVVAANQKINVAYPAITGASHYNIYIRNVTTGETWYGGNRRHGTADLTATTTLLSYDILSLGTRRPHFDFFSYDTTFFQPPINTNKGSFVVHISGTDKSAYYYQDIYDALVAAGIGDMMAYVNGGAWWNGQIVADSGATGAIAWYSFKQTPDQSLNNDINPLQGIIINNSTTFTMTWGTSQRGAVLYQAAWSWNISGQNQDWTEGTILGGNWQRMKAQQYIVGGDHYFIVNNNTGPTDGLNLKGVNIQNQKTNGPVVGIKTNGSLLIQLANASYENCESNGSGTLATFSAGQKASWKDCVISNATFSRHHRPRNLVPGGVFFTNNKWKNNTTSLPTAGPAYLDRPEIYYESGSGGLANKFYQQTQVLFSILDENNSPSEGAHILLENLTLDTIIIDEDTNASGQNTELLVPFEEGQYDGSGVYGNGSGGDYSWLHTDWTEYDFRLTITKEGYETIIEEFKFRKPLYAPYKLKTQIAQLEDLDTGYIFEKVDPANIEVDNIRRKVVKVA